MRIRHLIAVLLILGLGTVGVMAASYTVYPTTQSFTTGTTTYDDKNNGEALVYGGAVTGTIRMETGFFKFDITSVPDTGFTVAAVLFHFYVNATNYPYWSVTPLTLDPTGLSGAAALWDDAQAEKNVGYYSYQDEPSTYAPGWKTLVLGGTAVADLTAALGDDWFSMGAASRDDGDSTYFLEIDGHLDTNVPYMVVSDTPPPANDTCAGAIVIPGSTDAYSYTGDTTYAVNDYNCSSSCVGGLGHSGPDVAYTVTLTGDCEVCVTLDQSVMTWNGGVYMVEDCDFVNNTCVAGASAYLVGGEDETFCYSDTNGGTYYIIVDGRDGGGAGSFQLDVVVNCIVAPSDLTCSDDGGGAGTLAWTNNDAYDSIVIYQDGDPVATLAGTATSISVSGVEKGYHCYVVCGVINSVERCSDPCCEIFGYDGAELLWDFEMDDGGFIVDGTAAWEWGDPTYGPCAGAADGNVWATDLDADYGNNACLVLDSAFIPMGELSDKGGFVCFDHCYDTEATFDGGTIWFTTDDFWYYLWSPLDGWDGTIDTNNICPWVSDRPGFTGNSGGWVTDCWDMTADGPMGLTEAFKIRFAFGSDSINTASGWMIDNVTLLINESGTINCDYVVTPLSGTLPFQTIHRVTLSNLLQGGTAWFRRVAGRINVTIGNGTYFSSWRAGWSNIQPATDFTTVFPVNFPSAPTLVGINIFELRTEDVTPSPYNQPPYPAAGTTCTSTNVIVANAP